MRATGCSEIRNIYNLDHVLKLDLNSFQFPAREQSISCRYSNMLMALCAQDARSIETWVWTSVRPAYSGHESGEFFAHHDTRAKSSRPCSMVAVLLVREYISKHLSAVWVCELVSYYAPRSWCIKYMCIQVNLREKV